MLKRPAASAFSAKATNKMFKPATLSSCDECGTPTKFRSAWSGCAVMGDATPAKTCAPSLRIEAANPVRKDVSPDVQKDVQKDVGSVLSVLDGDAVIVYGYQCTEQDCTGTMIWGSDLPCPDCGAWMGELTYSSGVPDVPLKLCDFRLQGYRCFSQGCQRFLVHPASGACGDCGKKLVRVFVPRYRGYSFS